MLPGLSVVAALAALLTARSATAYCPTQRFLVKDSTGTALVPVAENAYLAAGSQLFGEADGVDMPICRVVELRIQRGGVYWWINATFGQDALTSSTQWAITLPTAAAGLSDGSWLTTAYTSATDNSQGGIANSFTFRVASGPCFASFQNVPPGKAFGSKPFHITGQTHEDCQDVTLTFTSSTGVSSSGTADVNGGPWWAYSWPPPDLPEGAYTITVQSKSINGSPRADSTVASRSVTIDKSPCPGVTLETLASGSTVTTRQPTLIGAKLPSALTCTTLQLLIDGNNDAYGFLNPDTGRYSVQVASALSDGPHNVRIISSDSAGERDPFTVDFQLVVAAPNCSPPTITSPPSSSFSYAGSSVAITGGVPQVFCEFITLSIPSLDNRRINTRLSPYSPYTSFRSWSATLSNLSPGSYDVSIVAAADTFGKWASTPVTRTIIITLSGCGVPVILAPIPVEGAVSGASLVIRGRATAGCGTVFTYLNGQKLGPEVLDANLEFERTVSNPQNDFYTLYITNEGGSNPPIESASLSFVYAAAGQVCGVPVLTAPLPNQVFAGRRFTFSGTLDPNPDCPYVSLLTSDPGEYRLAASSTLSPDGASFSGAYTAQRDGRYTFYLQRSNVYNSGFSPSRSDPFSVTLYQNPCPAPVLSSPVSGRTYNGQIRFAGTVDSRPECGQIEIYLDGRMIYSSATGTVVRRLHTRDTKEFEEIVDISRISPGTHTITVVSTGSSGGIPSPDISIETTNTPSNPQSTVTLGKKRSQCPAGRTLCSYRTSRGRNGFECVNDVSTNLERCGACDGPDCTALENVESVACVQSQCVVTQCHEGYALSNNTCVASATSALEETSFSLESIIDLGLDVFAASP